MFSYDEMRAIINAHLTDKSNQSRALDTAIMAACRVAYQRGLDDAKFHVKPLEIELIQTT